MLLKINMEQLAKMVRASKEKHFPSEKYVMHDNWDNYKDWYDKNFVTCIPIHKINVSYRNDTNFTTKISSKITSDDEIFMFGQVYLLWDNYELVLFVLDEDMQKFVEIYEQSNEILDLTNFIHKKNILLLDFILDKK